MISGYTKSEICSLYRQAKDKQLQITILTQLTASSKHEIEKILIEGGCLNQMTDLVKERILQLYKKELSDSAIAKELSLAQSQVSTFLRKQGLPPNGRLYNKKSMEEKEVEEVKELPKVPELKQDLILPKPELFKQKVRPEIETVQPEVKQNKVLEDLEKETKKNVDELKEILPKSMPTVVVEPEDVPINYDVIETLTPQQYYELAKMTLELLKTIWG